jgi:hypothetical protein
VQGEAVKQYDSPENAECKDYDGLSLRFGHRTLSLWCRRASMRAIAACRWRLPSDLQMVIYAGAETASTGLAVVGVAPGAMARSLGGR